jgi:collagenase-like PrtC family protease
VKGRYENVGTFSSGRVSGSCQSSRSKRADAVILGFEAFHSAKNFGFFRENEFSAAAEYCRIRGVKTYISIDTLITDGMLEDAIKLADRAVTSGADAIIVSDIGLLKALKPLFLTYHFTRAT